MPLYEFACQNKDCKHVSEVIKRVDDRTPIECSKCGGKTVKIISKTGKPKVVGGTPKFYP